jgi:hypothetical protein
MVTTSYMEQEAADINNKSLAFRPLHSGSWSGHIPITAGVPRESTPAITVDVELIHLMFTVLEEFAMSISFA